MSLPWIEHAGDPAPVVATLPHGGRDIPDDMARLLLVPPELLWSDCYTNELYSFLADVGITSVRTGLSRFVADPNRDPTTGHGGFWRTVVPAEGSNGGELYATPLTDHEVERRIAMAHAPFHALLDDELARRQHQRVLLLDLHSFGGDLDADVVIGDVNGTSARADVVDVVERAFKDIGLKVARNLRFVGGWIVRRFVDDDRVDAIQIELNQRVYLDAAEVDQIGVVPTFRPDLIDAARTRLRRAIEAVVEAVSP